MALGVAAVMPADWRVTAWAMPAGGRPAMARVAATLIAIISFFNTSALRYSPHRRVSTWTNPRTPRKWARARLVRPVLSATAYHRHPAGSHAARAHLPGFLAL